MPINFRFLLKEKSNINTQFLVLGWEWGSRLVVVVVAVKVLKQVLRGLTPDTNFINRPYASSHIMVTRDLPFSSFSSFPKEKGTMIRSPSGKLWLLFGRETVAPLW